MGKKRTTPKPDNQADVLVKIKLPKPIHLRLKMTAVARGQNLSEAIAAALDQVMPKYAE